MELAIGRSLFARFACDDYPAMADMLEEAVATMRRRTARLRGKTRQHIPTADEPLILIIVDELAALTAYITDRQLKERIKNALGVLLSQGRAVGVHVLARLQNPRKEILPFRNLFPTRIALRLTEDKEVDLVLNDGSRDRSALCDQIPKSLPGVAYVLLDGAVALSLAAQLAVAKPGPSGWMLCAVPALAFLALTKLVLTTKPTGHRPVAESDAPVVDDQVLTDPRLTALVPLRPDAFARPNGRQAVRRLQRPPP